MLTVFILLTCTLRFSFPQLFNMMFIYMHSANYPQHRNESSTILYAYIIFGLNLPWTLSCLRRYIVVPDSHPKRVFVIIYDSLVNMGFLRDQLILQVSVGKYYVLQFSHRYTLLVVLTNHFNALCRFCVYWAL